MHESKGLDNSINYAIYISIFNCRARRLSRGEIMRLPRRVAWTSIAELDQVCSWIFADENDIDSKVLAVNRVRSFLNFHKIGPLMPRSYQPGGPQLPFHMRWTLLWHF